MEWMQFWSNFKVAPITIIGSIMQGKRALDFDSLRDSGLNLAQGFIFFFSKILLTGCQNCSKFTWEDQEVGSG